MSSVLSIAHLSVVRNRTRIVEDVSFTAAAGHVTALIGPNGAGKTTLVKAVLGLLPISAGALRWNDCDIATLDVRARARLVAYVPQRSLLNAPMPVREVIATGRHAHRSALARISAADDAAITRALDACDVGHLAARTFDTLSGGEQHRVLLARALATEAPLVVLDEPTASLDIAHALAALTLMRRLAAEGRAVLVVLHHLDEVRRCADHAVLLHRGRVQADGNVDTVLTDEPLRTAFGVRPVPGGALGFEVVS
jgi:iron complex transport system ATP-binding protein